MAFKEETAEDWANRCDVELQADQSLQRKTFRRLNWYSPQPRRDINTQQPHFHPQRASSNNERSSDKIASMEDFHDEWYSDARRWTDSKLLNSSISTVSKALSSSLPHERVLDVYLRWIENHRTYPSNLTKDWEKTLVKWAQSLRARGFEKDELIMEIKQWKIEMGPFHSQNRRNRPMPYDIVKAWPESVCTRPESKPGKSDFSGKPPGDYTCNRCNTRGHFLEVCPTNLDPAFDKAPSDNYCCPICRKWGKHYRSLCPLNEDPFSIIQKRRSLGIETPDESKGRLMKDWEDAEEKDKDDFRAGNRARSWKMDSASTFREPLNYTPPAATRSPFPNYSPPSTAGSIPPNWMPRATRNTEEISKQTIGFDDMKLRVEHDEMRTEDVAMIRNKFNGDMNSQSQKRIGIVSPGSHNAHSRRLLNETSPSPTKARILRNKLAGIEAAEKDGEAHSEAKATLLAQLYEEENGGGKMGRESGRDSKKRDLDEGSDDIASDWNAPSSKRSKLANRSHHTSDTQIDDEMDIDQKHLPVIPKPKIMKYDEFIQKLIDCRPGMKEGVNHLKPRPNALDMWNADDDRRFKVMSISNFIKYTSMNSLDEEYSTMAKDMKDVSENDNYPAKNLNGLYTPAEENLIDLDSPADISKNKENISPAIDWY